MPADLRIVIVNWNAGPKLRACLESLAAANALCPSAVSLERVVVVDNGSRDGSAAGLEEIALPLTVIHNPQNRGFAAACNQGAVNSEARYLLFLNPDTRVSTHSLTLPVRFLEQPAHAGIGIAGLQLIDEQGAVSRSCARFPTPAHFLTKSLGLTRLLPRRFPDHIMEDWDHGSTREVDHVIGAFYLIRRSLFEEMEGFDARRFFVYLEDLDLSLRARRAGWRSVFLAEGGDSARVFHQGGGTSEQIKARRLFYALHSRVRYGYKHFGWPAATGLLLATLLVEPAARFGLALMQRSWNAVGETIVGYALLWRALLLPATTEQASGQAPNPGRTARRAT